MGMLVAGRPCPFVVVHTVVVSCLFCIDFLFSEHSRTFPAPRACFARSAFLLLPQLQSITVDPSSFYYSYFLAIYRVSTVVPASNLASDSLSKGLVWDHPRSTSTPLASLQSFSPSFHPRPLLLSSFSLCPSYLFPSPLFFSILVCLFFFFFFLLFFSSFSLSLLTNLVCLYAAFGKMPLSHPLLSLPTNRQLYLKS